MPWHRLFVAHYERTLREECGYTGAQPYWDYTLDAEPDNPTSMRIFESEVFDPVTGFGGNGAKVAHTAAQELLGYNGTGGGCVEDGPFVPKNFVDNFPGPGSSCLRRDFVPELMNKWADPAVVDRLMQTPDYVSFDRMMQGPASFAVPVIHRSGHFGVGGALGQAGDAANSPAEPLFYMHHCNVDWIFWKWQHKDWPKRQHEVAGNAVANDYTGRNVTLDFTVNLGNLAGNVTLGDLLDTQGNTLCYTY
ncbi:uncharacterized protein SETTUDRAFT_40621 [Exserohilum turcica Et28A]|uniref:Tyrosinase copper-binding domain-containing protein n=1 Tax=Exserohilum turcicum (strain 28A) TaxID=671987 RepID=R0J3T8_EXST2|nr:uncharacterized protein SETTUDRAFT_40621 [Exserohilum turcica Et28A]EOA91605.1 hypothetical protein SETTUDRAFT_40621 [Exserohilum turcica Et28A]